MEKKIEKYNVGLDIGTSSVGWCITDEENNILKNGKKNMWGARLFNEGQTAVTTRSFRGSKRRLERRKQRIKILQSLMLDDIEKEHANFFKILKESSLNQEDKTCNTSVNNKKYNLFSDVGMTDINYFEKYPTIYHLREELIKNKEKYDLRLVYLAIHHIIKYRGNFLYEGNLQNSDNDNLENIQIIMDYIKNELEIECKEDINKFEEILNNKNISKSSKKDQIIQLFDYDKDEKSILTAIISAILGYKFDITKIFDIEVENNKISFSEDIENEDEIKLLLGDKGIVYESLLRAYNWYILQDILQGEKYISSAFVKKYDKYGKDLELLKNVYKKYLKNEYSLMFRKEDKNNYNSYAGRFKPCSVEELYKRIKKDLEKVEECKEKSEILEQIESYNFLIKINTTANAAIPYQLHYQELEQILENQTKYYNTIKENKGHILELMKFRIPYYVGPLDKNNQSRFSWICRKTNEKILPWNFEEVVDIDETAEHFIKRMTNKCTYLLNEDVLAKQSILYSEFCVLNELANIKVNNQKLSSDLKNKIIEKLFKVNKNIKIKDFKNFLLDNQIYMEINSITGFADEDKFMSNMSAYIDMKKIFKDINEQNIDMIEKLIEWITIFEDKKILKRRIKKIYGLEDDIINKIAKLNYTGWARLSKKLLNEIKSKDDNKTIIEKMRISKENFMQIINNEKYGFDKQIASMMNNETENITYKNVEEIPTSPANKRAIWQTIKILKEITKVMKCEPENIYIEFARNEEKKIRKDNRAKSLLKIYDKFSEDIKQLRDYNPNIYKELKAKQNERDFNERLYLYFVQNGRCMYSSRPLNIDTLYLYEVDHILPQSYIKDDSLSNKVLVYKEENQRKSGSLLLDESIIKKQEIWWRQLHKNGLIDDKKLYNLTRRKMFETDNDRVKFISRQLVETRQITKYVTNILVNQYKNSNVFAVRAELSHSFREYFNIYKNRNINNYHHAQDAYIVSIIGNVINKKLHYKDEFKYTEYVKNYIKQEEENEEEKNRRKKWIIMRMVTNNIDIDKIKKSLYFKDCYITQKLEELTGEFYNQTLYSPKDTKVKIAIPLREGKSIQKYGGYSGENKAYFTIYSYVDSKNTEQLNLSGIPIKIAYDIKNKKITLKKYIEEMLTKNGEKISDLKIIKPKIMKYQVYLNENNEPMQLLSDTEIRVHKELIVNEEIQRLIYFMNKEKATIEEKQEVEEQFEFLYEYLLDKLHKEYSAFKTIYQKLNTDIKKNTFATLDYEEKRSVINGLIDLMQKGQGNLSKIGLGDRAGRMTGKNFKKKNLIDLVFIDKSITGMYERRYMVNGVENSCSE